MKKLIWVLAVALASQVALASAEVETEMGPFEKNGFYLAGAEYWPFVGNGQFTYPDDVLWGFQGEDNSYGRPTPATDAVQACARKGRGTNS